MRILTLLFSFLLSTTIYGQENPRSYEKEKKQLRELHLRCLESHKSSSNCHQDMMKACDLKQADCIQLMEEVSVKKRIKK